jgi:hypothetical protein
VATPVNSDFKDIVRVLSSARARFLVVGGFAVIEHTEPRYTKDLDLWVDPTPANAKRVYSALARFGAPLQGITERDFTNEQLVFQMGLEPVRIDVLMSLEGLAFSEAWRDRKVVRWGQVRVPMLSAAHLVLNKRLVGRPQDLADVARLEPVVGRAAGRPRKRPRPAG